MVAAGVGSAGLFVGAAVVGGDNGVQLAHDGDLHFGLAALQRSDDAGDGVAVGVCITHLVKGFFHLFSGFKLLVAQLRLGENRIAQSDDLVTVFVDGFASSLFEFFSSRHNKQSSFPS